MAIKKVYVPDFAEEGMLDKSKDLAKGNLVILLNDIPFTFPNADDYSGDSNKLDLDNTKPFKLTYISNHKDKEFDIPAMIKKGNLVYEEYDPNEGEYIEIKPDVMTETEISYNVKSDFFTTFFNSYYGYLTDNYFEPIYKIKETIPNEVENFPFIKLYKVDDDNLKLLVKEITENRYKTIVTNDRVIQEKDYSILGYISNLIRVPYKITSDNEAIPITVTDKVLQAKGQVLTKYLLEIYLGKINCYNGIVEDIGHKNIEFNLFVPNFKPIPLDVTKYINTYIDLFLNLDLTTGQGTLNIKQNDIVVHVEKELICKEIPIKDTNNTIDLNSDVLNTMFDKPYLEMTILTPHNSIEMEELKRIDINKSTYRFIKADNLKLTSNANLQHQLEINSLLNKGVYIIE